VDFVNSYGDASRADAYDALAFANTYYLAYRDIPAILAQHVTGTRALDFGCGTGRSTRFLRQLGFTVTGVDISEDMLRVARARDTVGDYRFTPGDNFEGLDAGAFDLVLSVFTFDNIPGAPKATIFRALRALLAPSGTIVSVVSTPEIYTHEWASFSTKDFPANAAARSGEVVRTIITDQRDRRPVEDIFCTDESYQAVYRETGLKTIQIHRPLATGDESYSWVNETRVPPWAIYTLRQAL
jgi:SAM-dependent methyltransferase